VIKLLRLSLSSRAREARRAMPGRRTGIAPRESAAGWPPGADAAGRAPAAFLWPLWPRRRRRALTPADPGWRTRRDLSGGARLPSGAIPPAPILKPCALTVKSGQERSLRSRRCAIPSSLWAAVPPQGFKGAYRRNGRVRAIPEIPPHLGGPFWLMKIAIRVL
jgi:hypothetical protein